MPSTAEITPWHWVIFTACVVVFLALDLGLFHRRGREAKLQDSLLWTAAWVALAMLFMGLLSWWRGHAVAVQFFTGYFIELSLSMDNVFIIALIFSHFRVPPPHQHRVLFWGILGALLMRGLMIGLGVALIARFEWILYVFGAFLILTGTKMLLSRAEGVQPEKSAVVRAARKIFPIARRFDGEKLHTRENGRWLLTPLFLVLLVVEMSDLVFAMDSIPAIFGVTRNAFVVFTSNVFAILGLRSLYLVLSQAIGLFRYLNVGLSVVLMFIGLRMLLDPHGKTPRWFQLTIPDPVSLLLLFVIIGVSILFSILAARRKNVGR